MTKTAWAVVIGIVVVVLLLGAVSLFFGGCCGYGSWGMMGGPVMMMMFMGGIGMLLFWGLVIAGIVWIVRSISASSGQPGTGSSGTPVVESPLDILKRRYAAGEISKEQFDEMRRNLDV